MFEVDTTKAQTTLDHAQRALEALPPATACTKCAAIRDLRDSTSDLVQYAVRYAEWETDNAPDYFINFVLNDLTVARSAKHTCGTPHDHV